MLGACERRVGVKRKEIACTAGRMGVLEALSVCTKDLNGSKRVFNINFVAT